MSLFVCLFACLLYSDLNIHNNYYKYSSFFKYKIKIFLFLLKAIKREIIGNFRKRGNLNEGISVETTFFNMRKIKTTIRVFIWTYIMFESKSTIDEDYLTSWKKKLIFEINYIILVELKAKMN